MYQLTKRPEVIYRLTDGAWIPVDPGNGDYRMYLAWLAEGNQPLPVEGSDAN